MKHKKLLRYLSIVLSLSIIFTLAGCACDHTWVEATCVNPKTCSKCNETEGGTNPHQFSDATCVTPKTCQVCGMTDGETLEHNGEWSDWDTDYIELVKTREYMCLDCEQIVETESVDVTTFVGDNIFTIYPARFAARLDEQSTRLNNIELYSKAEYNEYSFYDEDNTLYYRIQDANNGYKDIGMYSFDKPNGKLAARMDAYSENTAKCINILIERSYDVAAVVYSAILAIDPSIGYSEAADVGQEIVDNMAIAVGDLNEEDFQGINYNGINYLFFKDRKYHYLVISVASPN